MSDGRWVRTIVIGIVIGNLVVLSIFFLSPRIQFLLAHKGWSSGRLMETAGSRDMPNQLLRTYSLVNRIDEMTPEGATLFMPPGDRLQGTFRSAAIQILYPRKIIFGEDENFDRELEVSGKIKESYLVYSPLWKPGFCEETSRRKLTDSGFGMCKLNE